jgi:hypothetical protein
MGQLITEIIVVGFLTSIIGVIVSYLMMGQKSKDFEHWDQLALSYFITGALIHIICEFSNINKWYCTNGNACREKNIKLDKY